MVVDCHDHVSCCASSRDAERSVLRGVRVGDLSCVRVSRLALGFRGTAGVDDFRGVLRCRDLWRRGYVHKYGIPPLWGTALDMLVADLQVSDAVAIG